MLYKIITLTLILVSSTQVLGQEDASKTPKAPLQEIPLKDTSNYLVPFSFDPTLTVGAIKEKIARDFSLPTDNLDNIALEFMQTGTLKGTGRPLSETRPFTHYQELIPGGYKELLVYSKDGPEIKLDPTKRAPVQAIPTTNAPPK